jgi:hypothetical protein
MSNETVRKYETIDQVRMTVADNIDRVAELGKWPANVDRKAKMLGRIPAPGQRNAPGFDAGIACALGLIPANKQRLAAVFHGNYTPEAVAQVRREVDQDQDFAETETGWWLAASSVCVEGTVNEETFMRQVKEFSNLAADRNERDAAANAAWCEMQETFDPRDGVAYATTDGGMVAAYVHGYDLAVYYDKDAGLYFIGTYKDSLGLDGFQWSEERDAQGRTKSGPVNGSKNFVKAANEDEMNRVVAVAKKHLDIQG